MREIGNFEYGYGQARSDFFIALHEGKDPFEYIQKKSMEIWAAIQNMACSEAIRTKMLTYAMGYRAYVTSLDEVRYLEGGEDSC